MKKAITILTICLLAVAGMQKARAQDKTAILDWLRSNLKTVIVHDDDPDLSYTMTKTYTFYDNNFVVKTVKDFEDKDLNSAPAFSKIWYKDMIPEKEITFQNEHPDGANIFTITANPVYYIIGKEEAPLQYWRHFDEPSGLDLFLPKDEKLSVEIINKIMKLKDLSSGNENNQK